ncbi:hypothetical protein [Butyrivibrio sp. WCD2001]|uniref:hypothetical protein n=1 Tax=Butyrivibrio sp. WCD2001 TaxID=1280681 RepID=UPI0004797DE4|nr:hypothetical protein [Butyrivibrio sp. WCD2001]
MEINKNTLTEFRRDFKEAVASLEEKYDVTISLGSISYSENDFTSKLTVNNGHDKDDIAQREFDRDVWKYAHLGLGKGMYKRIFVGLDGNKYTAYCHLSCHAFQLMLHLQEQDHYLPLQLRLTPY